MQPCSTYYAELLDDLRISRDHGSTMAQIEKNHIRNSTSVRSLGQNHKARRKRLWVHILYSHENYICHRYCISKLTQTDTRTLTRICVSFVKEASAYKLYSACDVLNDLWLLRQLLFSGVHLTSNWYLLNVKRHICEIQFFTSVTPNEAKDFSESINTNVAYGCVFKAEAQDGSI